MALAETRFTSEQLPELPSSTLVRSDPRNRYRTALKYMQEIEICPECPCEVLDVGGFRDNPVLKEILPEGVRAKSLNIEEEYHVPKRIGDITYDGIHMGFFPDSSVPLVMAVDVFQHVDERDRLPLLQEMVRVAKDKVIIAVPIHSDANVAWENALIRQMIEANLPPKSSIMRHRTRNSLPRLSSLTNMARTTGYSFKLEPATRAAIYFHGMLNQVTTLKENYTKNPQAALATARTIASNTEDILEYDPDLAWPEAYRAVMVIDKHPRGKIVTEEKELYYSQYENVAYGRALSMAGWGNIDDPTEYYDHIPQRGFNIAFEGQDGTGKTDIIEIISAILADRGYTIAKPSRMGPRQRLREKERRDGKLFDEPAREAQLASTTIESCIAGNAHTLGGPCNIAFCDRTLASVEGYHTAHGIQQPVEYVLEGAPRIPPDMTILLEVDDETENWKRMRIKNDLANNQIKIDELRVQRHYYNELKQDNCVRYTGRLVRVKNNGPLEDTVMAVLKTIEKHCGIQISQNLTTEMIREYFPKNI
ncbi:hypothetical protein COY59_00095 [Candidatus Gottesmanbacteria bacterium CG_4_10_14_0_8_um_filter_37_24]|uniref:Thymidylate kinase-like domain-containing protein n=1 Tax=Candidatus Gottesmanbacteria bacterium CG_4_10_14_0_8_um_filter_37_24 TaxID=1974574 RepID=A0A2M7RSX7_9BACT|nr:MAG: hypothetical protein COY59_00095 [Candidatus Gottesmanbacteria bacterium CG_4_10_14_0_8_um_filter_37_24]